MVTALGMGLYLAVFRRGRPPAFLVGFVAGGLMATLAVMVWIWTAPHSLTEVIDKLFPRLFRAFQRNRISIDALLAAYGLITGLPQFLAALAVGWLARRLAARAGPPGRDSGPPAYRTEHDHLTACTHRGSRYSRPLTRDEP